MISTRAMGSPDKLYYDKSIKITSILVNFCKFLIKTSSEIGPGNTRRPA